MKTTGIVFEEYYFEYHVDYTISCCQNLDTASEINRRVKSNVWYNMFHTHTLVTISII